MNTSGRVHPGLLIIAAAFVWNFGQAMGAAPAHLPACVHSMATFSEAGQTQVIDPDLDALPAPLRARAVQWCAEIERYDEKQLRDALAALEGQAADVPPQIQPMMKFMMLKLKVRLGLVKPNQQQPIDRPKFASLVTDAVLQSVATLPDAIRENAELRLRVLTLSDEEPATLQIQTCRLIAEGLAEDGVSRGPDGIFTIHKTPEELKTLSREIKQRMLALEQYARTHPTEAEVLVSQQDDCPRTDGFKSLRWGAIPNWREDAVKIRFKDGTVFSRLSCAQSQPERLVDVYYGVEEARSSVWFDLLPRLELLPGRTVVFVRADRIANLRGLVRNSFLIVREGRFIAFADCLRRDPTLTPRPGVEDPFQEAAVIRDCNEASNGFWRSIREGLGIKAAAHGIISENQANCAVTWKSRSGTAVAAVTAEVDERTSESMQMRSKDFLVRPTGWIWIPGTQRIREGITQVGQGDSEFVKLLVDLDREINGRAVMDTLLPSDDVLCLIIPMLKTGVDKTVECNPPVTLQDDNGNTYQDLGGDRRDIVLQAIRGIFNNRAADGFEIPEDKTLLVDVKRLQGKPWEADTHGRGAMVFFVPKSARALTMHLRDAANVVRVQMPAKPVVADYCLHLPYSRSFDAALRDSMLESMTSNCFAIVGWDSRVEPAAKQAEVDQIEERKRRADQRRDTAKKAEDSKREAIKRAFDN